MIITKSISTLLKDGIRYATLLVFGKKDARTAPVAAPYGIDSNVIAGMQALYMMSSVNGKPVFIGCINTNQLAAEGEIRLYSTDADGELKTFVWVKNDGTLELGGDANFAVKFNELKTEFNSLKSSHNNLVTAFNAHMHPTAATGVPSAPTPVPGSIPATPNTANIDNAKNPKIKTV